MTVRSRVISYYAIRVVAIVGRAVIMSIITKETMALLDDRKAKKGRVE